MHTPTSTLSRRSFVGRVGALAALGSGGLYELLDRLAQPASATRARAGSVALPSEQYIYALPTVVDNGVAVLSPPLHRAVVTASLASAPTSAAQHQLEAVLSSLEQEGLVDFTAAGGSVTLAWGVPYFNRLPPNVVGQYMPSDRAASALTGTTVPVLVDAPRFKSDPPALILETNDLAVVVASNSLERVNTILERIFDGEAGGLFQVMSIRRGFIDATALGSQRQSLTKQMALAAGIPGASSIPDQAQLFLGFTSTQRTALAPANVPSFETLPGLTDQWPSGYFAGGTALHLSHIREDVARWYQQSYSQRVGATFSPDQPLDETARPMTLAMHPASEAEVREQFARHGHVGHSSSLQPRSRLQSAVVDNYGVHRAAGTPIAFRADFNTLDNPFAFSASPATDRFSTTPSAGLHFLAYTPTSVMFQLMREAMEGWYGRPGLGTAAIHGPFNRILHTTHRQNFLVPPRARRSFPLVELVPAATTTPASTVTQAASPSVPATTPVELYI